MIGRVFFRCLNHGTMIDFLLNAGTGWSATTPFYFTLAKQQKYCHSGHQKEMGYLKLMGKKSETDISIYKGTLRQRSKPDVAWIKMVDNREFVSKEETEELLKPPYTIDKYIDYYLGLHEKTKGTYQAVADFTNYNFELPEEFLIEWRDKMSQHFNVKVTFQFRDPIRRYFSEVGKFIQGKLILPGFDSHKIKHNAYVKSKQHIKLFRHYISSYPIFPPAYYTQNIEKFKRVFGEERVMPIIMEQFWNPERKTEQCERLSDFLNYKITEIHENAYYPDRGTNAPHYEGLKDQWGSDFEDMTPQLYEWSKQYLGFVYSDWEKCYETLPEEWNR